MNVLWFGGLLFLFAAEAAASAAWLHRILPGVKIWLIALLEAAAIMSAAIYNPAWLKNSTAFVQVLFPLLAGLLVLPLIGIVFAKRGKVSWEKPE